MEAKISTSPNPQDYEILIRKRGDGDYASYCPQLNLFIKGEAHELVRAQMQERIYKHCEAINQVELDSMPETVADEIGLPLDDVVLHSEETDDFLDIDQDDEISIGFDSEEIEIGLDSSLTNGNMITNAMDEFPLDFEEDKN